MTKLQNQKFLQNAVKFAKPDVKKEVSEVARLFETRVIHKFITVENIINKLTSNNKLSIEKGKKLLQELEGKKPIVSSLTTLKNEIDNRKQLNEIMNIEGYNQSSEKKSREQRIEESTKHNLNKVEVEKELSLVKSSKYSTKEALHGTFQEVRIDDEFHHDEQIFDIQTMKDAIVKELERVFKLNNDKSNKINIFANIKIEFIMLKKDEDNLEKLFFFHSAISSKLNSINMIDEFAIAQVEAFLEKFSSSDWTTGSDWVFKNIDSITIQISKTKITKAGSYIETPSVLALKRAIVNIKNINDKCILYAIAASQIYETMLSPLGNIIKDKNNPKYYEQYIKKNIIQPENITYPIDIQTDIRKFEKLNNMKINVFRYDDKDVKFENLLTVYNTTQKIDNVINLLILSKDNKDHIVWIKSINKLFRMNIHHERRFFCSQCLNASFDSQIKLDEHHKLCNNNEAVHCIMPRKFDPNELDDNGKVLKREDQVKFKNYGNKFKHPFNIVLDFESTLEKINDVPKTEIDENNEEQKTTKYQKHICNSVGIKFNSIHEFLDEPEIIFNSSNPEEVSEKTILQLEEYAIKSYKYIKQNEKLDYANIPKNIKNIHFDKKYCDDCNVKLDEINKRAMHHDHITGQYISTLCRGCNLNYQYKLFLPVNIHNLKGYDSHFLVPALNKYGYHDNEADLISAIPSNEEKYISFSKKIKVGEYQKKNIETKELETKNIMFEIRFIDTIAFMPSSLCSLIDNLKVS